MTAPTLEQLQNINQPVYEQLVISESGGDIKGNARLAALREAAEGVGARGGLLFETTAITRVLKRVERNLDTVYDFSSLMIQRRVVPPVLIESRDVYTQNDSSSLRLAGRIYKVEAQARFASRAPHWQDYLYVNYGDQDLPPSTMLPRNDEEQTVWKKAVTEGWEQGIKQGRFNFQTNFNRLNRDYIGMTRYHILELKGMVTLPIVAQQRMPINASGETMNLDETLLRITALPSFNARMNSWSPLPNEEDVLSQPTSVDKPVIPADTDSEGAQ